MDTSSFMGDHPSTTDRCSYCGKEIHIPNNERMSLCSDCWLRYMRHEITPELVHIKRKEGS